VDLTLPGRPEDVTATWLTDALRRSGALDRGSAVTGFDAEPVGTGQMGDSVRFRLTYAGAGGANGGAAPPHAVVGKFASADERSRTTGLMLRSYEIEVRFYQQLAASLPIRTPHAYHADIDTTTGIFVLLMEDLAPAVVGDQLAGCTVDEAALALEELAKLHAPRWGDAGLASYEWLDRTSDESLAIGEQMLPMLFTGFRERYADQLDAEILAVGDRLVPLIPAYLRDRPRPWTIQHGDYRVDNMLFGTPEGGYPLAVVDWQTMVHGPGLVDAAYFLGAGLPIDVRRARELDLLREYHRALTALGVDGYSWDRCFEDYRRYTYAGYVMAVGASMMVERTDRGDEMFMTMARRHGAHVLDLEAESLLRP
jgi:hypothetical protein